MLRILIALTLLVSPALAWGQSTPASDKEQFLEECSACHLAFPANFLPMESWEVIMANLSDHFGEDASLSSDAMTAIEGYLIKHAARSKSRAFRGFDLATAPPLRITELRWFKHEHSHEVSARAKKKAGTMSNCQACHKAADRGYFDDD